MKIEKKICNSDKTPFNFSLQNEGVLERIKKIIRKFVYPIYNGLNSWLIKRKYGDLRYNPDLWLRDHRGNDYATHRRRVNKYKKIKNSKVVVAGCGTGRDIPSWLAYKPKELIGVDLFSYNRAWVEIKTKYEKKYRPTKIDFIQADLSNISEIKTGSVDILGSDAVFEHLKKPQEVISEFNRILAKDGLLYASFGPLWYCWGGDHISGFDDIKSGYNHLVLDKNDYDKYIEGLGQYTHDEEDGRTWVLNDLFSKLKIAEYINLIEESGFSLEFWTLIIDSRAECFVKRYGEIKLHNKNCELLDMIVTGMSIICRKQ